MRKSILNLDIGKSIMLVLLLGLIVLAFGCTKINGTPPGTEEKGNYIVGSFDPKASVSTVKFGSVKEYTEFIKAYSNTGGYYGGYGRMIGAPVAMAGGMEKTADSSGEQTLNTQNDYSKTNNQVEGVDEADIIKTDGKYIYTISGNTVFIVKAYPGEDAEVVSKLSFNSSPQDLFIEGKYLAVFGNFYDLDYFKRIDFTPRQGMTFFNIYDISDKENPELVKEYKFEGNYFDARMKQGFVYFVVRSAPVYRLIMPLPVIIEGTTKREMPLDHIYRYDIPYRYPELVSVHSINLKNPEEDIESKAVSVEGSQNLYMSEDNLFITYTETINEYELQQEILRELLQDKLSDSDKELIEKIKEIDNNVLSQAEKEQKIMSIYYSYQNYLTPDESEKLNQKAQDMLDERLKKYEHMEYTMIHKIGISEGNIEIKENEKVPGHIMNQFSLDENNGVLRIATTLSARWSYSGKESTKSSNNVYALDENMRVVGRLEGLAEDESIYSTRFIGNKLYMVTFRQVDPFFVIDLSDPTDIKELGKLKIPGFSRYLHPYDENTIIGVGNDATDSGRVSGLKIAIFDVSDFAHPKQTASFVTDERYATSTALYEHKAFLFSKDKELLVIPAYSYDYDYRTDHQKGYNGAFVFKITKESIELRGLIDHSDGKENYYGALVERSLYINELLYTKSPSLLRINKIADLSSVKRIALAPQKTGGITVY